MKEGDQRCHSQDCRALALLSGVYSCLTPNSCKNSTAGTREPWQDRDSRMGRYGVV